MEFSDPSFPAPAIVEPLGVVPKNGDPPFRLVTDSRRGNKSLAKWPVKFTTVTSLVHRVDYGDLGSGSDVSDAYHCFHKGGCGGGARRSRVVFVSPSGSRYWQWVTRIGCTPATCTGTCDKARSGVDLDGMLARFATSHFGETPAGSPLNTLMQELRRYFARRGPFAAENRVDSASWVDDLLLLFKSKYHGRCGGIRAGCIECAHNKELADSLEEHWLWLAPQLGLPLSADKRQRASQMWEYSGILFDSIRGLLLIPDRKLVKVVDSVRGVAEALQVSARELSSVAGRLLHYSICIPHVRPFIPFLWAIVGCEGVPDYDRTILVSPELRQLCSYLLSMIPLSAPRGRTMWPFVASSLYAALCRGDTAGARVRAITFDGSVGAGWGAALQTSEDPQMVISSHTYPPGTDSSVQVHNEGRAGAGALEAFDLLVDLSDSVIIFRNDCVGALTALELGCTTSAILQDAAMRVARCCARHNATCLFLHVPGSTLVAEGVDAASRSGAQSERGPACGPALRQRIIDLAASYNWEISIDLFASTENAITPRFCSRYPELGAECADALLAPDWNVSTCPSCGEEHREVIFAFPPANLLSQFVAKARADGVRGIVLTPTAPTGAHWNKLLRASLAKDGPGYTAIRHPMPLLTHACGFSTSELALIAVDFGPGTFGQRNTRPPCPAAALPRPRPSATSLPADPAISAVRADLQRFLRQPGPFPRPVA
jgi:hypothetical protein